MLPRDPPESNALQDKRQAEMPRKKKKPAADAYLLFISDEQGRELSEPLLEGRSGEIILEIIKYRARIATLTSKRKRPQTSKEYVELVDRAKRIFKERAPRKLMELAYSSVDAALDELPGPERELRHDLVESVQAGLEMRFRSDALAKAVRSVNKSWLSQSFIAALYYWGTDPADPDAIAKARQKYEKMPGQWRNRRLKAYRQELKRKARRLTEMIQLVQDLHSQGTEKDDENDSQ